MANRRSKITPDEAVLMYSSGMSLSEIGAAKGCHAQTVLNRLKEAGYERRSLSVALNGRDHTWGDKISEANSGKILSQETKDKISRSATGRKSPLKGKRKATHPDEIKTGCSGENHWNWKGGISSENLRLRQSSEYKAWRDEVFKRDDWTCQICGIRGGYLEADHIKKFSDYPGMRLDVDNGRTLCKNCHKAVTKEQRNSNVK